MRVKSWSVVSVIIPTHNRAKILEATLESVLSQTYPAIEIIVVDDGSTDETTEVIARYGKGIRYLKQSNQGVEEARKHGIQMSTGDLVTFLDDDDLMAPTKIERQTAILNSCPDIGVVHCRYRYIDSEGNIIGESGNMPEGDMRKSLVWGCPPWSGGPLIRRRCFDCFGTSEHPDWYGDWGMWLRITFAGNLWACAQEPLGDYRIVPGSMIDNRIVNCERLVFHILQEVFESWDLPREIHAEKDKIYAGWHFWLSCRFYTMDYWEDARRNLLKTLQFRPGLSDRPGELLELFYREAIGVRVRVHDPIRFINGVFDHLPHELDMLNRSREWLLSRIYSALAVRDYALGKIRQAQNRLGKSLRLSPGFIDHPTDFITQVGEYVQSMPDNLPGNYVDSIIRNLPQEALSWKSCRSRLSAAVSIARAFRAYGSGCRISVPAHFISAVCRDPIWLKNRAAVAAFIKSLPALLHSGPRQRFQI